ncbi:MAG: outer membrane beta-barrel protein [Pseudomonadota bacterium]
MTRIACLAFCLMMAGAPAFSDSFSGPYGGVQLGFATAEGSGAVSADGEGTIGGGHIGYDADLGNYVVGGEIDFDRAELELGNGTAEIDSVARLKIRAGGTVGDTRVYGTFGLAHVDTSLGNDNGYVVGAGVGQQVGDWVLGGEVLFHQFDDIDGSGVDAEATTVTFRASFQF